MGFIRWHEEEKKVFFFFSFCKKKIAKIQTKWPNSAKKIIHIWKAIDQANEVVEEYHEKHAEKLPKRALKYNPKPQHLCLPFIGCFV